MKKKRKLKKDRKKSWEIWQGHHITYEPEYVVYITRTEHFFIGRVQRYFATRGISEGMKEALKWCGENYPINKTPKEINDKNRATQERIKRQGIQNKTGVGNQGRPEA